MGALSVFILAIVRSSKLLYSLRVLRLPSFDGGKTFRVIILVLSGPEPLTFNTMTIEVADSAVTLFAVIALINRISCPLCFLFRVLHHWQ